MLHSLHLKRRTDRLVMVDVEEGVRLQVSTDKNILNSLQLNVCCEKVACLGVLD